MLKTCGTCGEKRHMFSWETECYSCRTEKHKKELKRQIEDGEITETDCEDEVYCPYCGEEYEQDVDDYELYNEGETELVCPECDKLFVVEVSVSYSYATKRQEVDKN